MHILRTCQRVETDLVSVFRFFSQPENLTELTPDWLNFQILTPSPIPLREGALIDYRLGLGLLPTRWRTMITTYEPPHVFVDEQLLGPYSFWHHTHRFEEADGETLLKDEVRYLLPCGALGEAVHALAVRPQLERIFRHRHRVIAQKFGGDASSAAAIDFV